MLKKILKKILPRQVINLLRCLKASLSETSDELSNIREIPRFTEGETNILGKSLKFVDSASFCFMFDEIFKRQIYNFQNDNPTPYIIDAGANIGLSVIYFKKLYPDAEIIAFEPDKKIFSVLEKNIKSFGLRGITLVPKALWNGETQISFFSEGADAGRIQEKDNYNQFITVETDKLSSYLNRKVDFLKIDIEGTETIVLDECKNMLHNVEKIFVEYHSFVDKKQTLHRLLQILNDEGFRYQVQSVGVYSSKPFLQVNIYNNMDLQLNIFAYRV